MFNNGKNKKRPARRAKRVAPRPPAGKKLEKPADLSARVGVRVPSIEHVHHAIRVSDQLRALIMVAQGFQYPHTFGDDPEQLFDNVATELDRIGDCLWPPRQTVSRETRRGTQMAHDADNEVP